MRRHRWVRMGPTPPADVLFVGGLGSTHLQTDQPWLSLHGLWESGAFVILTGQLEHRGVPLGPRQAREEGTKEVLGHGG